MSEGAWFKWLLVAIYLFGAFSLPCLPRSEVATQAQHRGPEAKEGNAAAQGDSERRPISTREAGDKDKAGADKGKECGGGLVCSVVWPRVIHLADVSTYDPVAFFTLVLAVSTIGLWWVTRSALLHAQADSDRQTKQTESSLAIAKQAADAATLTARNLLRATKPFITMEQIYLERFDAERERFELAEDGYKKAIHATMKNRGTTQGFVRETRFASIVSYFIGPPVEADDAGSPMAGYEPILAEENVRFPLPFYFVTLNDKFDTGNLQLYVWGWIRYGDIHGIVRRSGFAFEYLQVDDDPFVKGYFVPCGDGTYWYDVEEPAKDT